MNISTPKYGKVTLGRQGENLATKVVLDVTALKIAPGHPVLVHQRPRDTMPYPVAITVVGDTVEWLVTSADTQYSGDGRLELRWYGVGGELVKSAMYTTITIKSLAEPGDPPPVLEGYISQFKDSITPHIGENKNWFIGETDTGVRAEGVDGKDGVGITNITITEE